MVAQSPNLVEISSKTTVSVIIVSLLVESECDIETVVVHVVSCVCRPSIIIVSLLVESECDIETVVVHVVSYVCRLKSASVVQLVMSSDCSTPSSRSPTSSSVPVSSRSTVERSVCIERVLH